MEKEKQSADWLNSLDIGFLTETERDMIIDVLRRNEKLATIEKKRVIQLKCNLRDVRRRGAKKTDSTYSTHVCARCNASTGHIINKAHTCPICKHKVCEACIVTTKNIQICVVCHKESKIKAKTGEWFYDVMRADLKLMQDGSTLLKQAVMATSPSRHLTSVGSMESLSSSTESHSYSYPSSKQSRLGLVETGSIESLRSLRYMGREYFSDSDHSIMSSPASPVLSVKSMTLRNKQRTVSEGRYRTSTLPRMKPPMLMPSSSYDVASLDRRSMYSVSDQDTFSAHSKSSSNAMKKTEVSGAKLNARETISQSVPSLAVQNEDEATKSGANINRDTVTLNHPRFVSHRKSSSLSNIKEKTDTNDVTTGSSEIKFSLKFDYKGDNLLVHVAECRNLVYADSHRKTCDPYVKCYLLPDRSMKRKTSVKKQTTSPVFNQDLMFPVNLSELGNRVLEMSVWNSATFSKNSFLGHLQVGLDSWKWQSSPSPHWYPLKQKVPLPSLDSVQYNGNLSLAISYRNSDKCDNKHGELHVMIKQAKNLLPVLRNGTVNAFVKLVILPEKNVYEKTKCIGGSVNPLWNVTFCLPLLSRPIEDSGLLITVLHKPHGSRTSRRSRSRLSLGGILLAATTFKDNTITSTDEEAAIWKNVIKSNGSWTEISLGLRTML